ncbi:glycosyl hydrolase [Coraliomargarita parva]|uniref:glycosyl hydrolase n=1 Tax=Coraliomargarita parva TaxID=3014050 RepID=UPI0022B34C4C|nr:glycosyl hydrolase [Coraliomargarita parva]
MFVPNFLRFRGECAHRFRWRVILAIALTLRLACPASADRSMATPKLSDIRIVDCAEVIQSPKRGVAANRLSEADFRALAPGVSWYYNWSYAPGGTGTPPEDVAIEFIPMVWGGGKQAMDGLKSYISGGHRPRAVLAINEPNLVEHHVAAGMTPEKTARIYGEVKAITDRYGIPLIGPQMSIGSPPHMSVTAYDPIEGEEVTYTYMVPFLHAFFYYAQKQNTEVDGLGMHPYMAAPGVEGLMNQVAASFGKPIWITEFSNSDQPLYDIPYKLRDLVQSVDYMERTPAIQAYAYFKERNAAHPPLSLFTGQDGELNELGKAYVQMPVHDPALYYRLPGRLQAERYVSLADATVWPTTDQDGFLHMSSEAIGSRLNYHVSVETTGDYRIRVRVTGGPGKLGLRFGKGAPFYLDMPQAVSGWQTLETLTELEAGPQVLYLKMDAKPFGINWIEVERVE